MSISYNLYHSELAYTMLLLCRFCTLVCCYFCFRYMFYHSFLIFDTFLIKANLKHSPVEREFLISEGNCFSHTIFTPNFKYKFWEYLLPLPLFLNYGICYDSIIGHVSISSHTHTHTHTHKHRDIFIYIYIYIYLYLFWGLLLIKLQTVGVQIY